jgi:hypothetical protein
MTRTAAAVAYDSAGNLVLSIGARNAVGEDVVVDTSDVTSVPDSSERTEILRTLRAEGYLVTSAEYADSLAEHAAADVLTELSDLQPRTVENVSVIRGGQTNDKIVSARFTSASVIRPPVVVRGA